MAGPPVIHAVTPYGRGAGSSRVRVFEWLDRVDHAHSIGSYISHRNASPRALAQRPIAVLRAERALRALERSRPSHLLLHREASPLSRGDLERRLLRSADFSVYDFDDALHEDHGAGSLVRRWAPKARKAQAAVQAADRIIAASPRLADWASDHHPDVALIPSCVAPDDYRSRRDYEISDPPRLGWIGSADNEVYLKLIEPVLTALHERRGARLLLIGTTTPRLGAMERYIDRVAWSIATQRELIATMDIGIMPVPDEPYTRGKAGYKLLQYAAAGVPAMGSPVGVNASILAELGMPAPATRDEWADALDDAVGEPASARRERGEKHLRVVTERYSFDAWKETWERTVGLTSPHRDRSAS